MQGEEVHFKSSFMLPACNFVKKWTLSQDYFKVWPTITHKIPETNSRFNVKYSGKGLISVFQEFSATIDKAFFWWGHLALGYHFMEFRYFPGIS